jgi:hypothetical protein
MGERVTQDSHDLGLSIGTHVSNLNLSVGGCQCINPLVGDVRKQPELPIESLPSTQGGGNMQPKTESPTASVLSLHCRMCEAPPTVTTQPTVTTCGHLFCSEYVLRMLGGATRGLTPRQVHNSTRSIHFQMPRVQQRCLVVLLV